MKCEYSNKCEYYEESSYTCNDNGGEYCGKYRKLKEKENRNGGV
jgi:hypothetical protein